MCFLGFFLELNWLKLFKELIFDLDELIKEEFVFSMW